MRFFAWLTWKRFRHGLAGLLLVLAVLLGSCWYAYPGLCVSLVNQLWYASATENRNLYRFYDYWLRNVERLELDRSTGIYNFERAAKKTAGDPFETAQIEFHRGNFAAAIELSEQAIAEEGKSEEKLFWLALSCLRQAETDNCLATLRARPASTAEAGTVCALPITCCHRLPAGATRAASLFEELLDDFDATDPLYRWLLNFSYMATGGFPDRVPPRYRIDGGFVDAFYGQRKDEMERRHAELVFRDRARELQVDTFDAGRGVAVEDFDQDGYLDIVTGGMFESLRYYGNSDGRSFAERTEPAGLDGIRQVHTITSADYDNDGWIDLFVSRPFHQFCLLRNLGDGTFRNVTQESGLLDAKSPDELAITWMSSWSDVDGDGDLDLMLAQCATSFPFLQGLIARIGMDSTLFVNEDGRFVDRTGEFGLRKIVHKRVITGASFGDYDSDGDPDLFLSSPWRNTSVLLRNDAGRRFRRTALIDGSRAGSSAAFVDVNHDGQLDIFQGGYTDGRTSTLQTVFDGELDAGRSTIFLQADPGRFVARDDFFRGAMPMGTMGASYGDLNNDGAYDFYLGTGSPESWFVLPNLMYLGETDGAACSGFMDNISMLDGFGTIQKGHGIVFFDYDEDGDQDVYSSLGGMWPGDPWPNQFFVNDSRVNHAWIKIRLQGTQTNRFAVGAKIRVVARNHADEKRVRYYHIDQKTGFGSAPFLAHIGLLDATSLESVDVFWPVSKTLRRYPCRLNELNNLSENSGTKLGDSATFD